MLYSLQALRAFAAWVVVCHHFMQIFFDFHATGPIGQLLTDRGAVGVDIFFVISGLVIYLSTRDKTIEPRQFLLNRVLRIVPAYWFYTALMAALLLASANGCRIRNSPGITCSCQCCSSRRRTPEAMACTRP